MIEVVEGDHFDGAVHVAVGNADQPGGDAGAADLEGVAVVGLGFAAGGELVRDFGFLGDLKRAIGQMSVFDPGADVDTAHGAFMDSAAIMMNLDLVITTDTSIPHLAGALGVPVWLALPFVPDWRWLLERSDSPWYPTMRLFRQKKPGDWESVFKEIAASLRLLVEDRT